MHPQRVVIACGSGAGMLGVFLPWASLVLGSVDGTQMGVDGWFIFGCFAVLLLAATRNGKSSTSRSETYLMTLVALVTSLAAVYKVCAVHDVPMLRVGGGLILIGIASTLVTCAIAFGGGFRLPMALTILVVALAGWLGFVHIPYGDKLPATKLCSKQGWSLVDTFPDVDQFSNTSLTENNAKLVHALVACDILHLGP